uniref:Uncharacterized protein n=1 Tax=Arundo donax TaxID=35708 RepID=A0A0A9QN98_ARUDO
MSCACCRVGIRPSPNNSESRISLTSISAGESSSSPTLSSSERL